MKQCFTQTRKRRTKVGHGPSHTFIIPIGKQKKLEVWYSFGKNPKVRFSFFFCKFPKNDEPYMYKVRHFDIGWKDNVLPQPSRVRQRSAKSRSPSSNLGGSSICPRQFSWQNPRLWLWWSRVRFPPFGPHAELAQLGEHLPYKQRVGGSSPSFRTKSQCLLVRYSEDVCGGNV